jgi:hypothetical protein
MYDIKENLRAEDIRDESFCILVVFGQALAYQEPDQVLERTFTLQLETGMKRPLEDAPESLASFDGRRVVLPVTTETELADIGQWVRISCMYVGRWVLLVWIVEGIYMSRHCETLLKRTKTSISII